MNSYRYAGFCRRYFNPRSHEGSDWLDGAGDAGGLEQATALEGSHVRAEGVGVGRVYEVGRSERGTN